MALLQCAAPDVLRFLMLSHALAAPGWIGREELVNIRGVPPGAQVTVSRHSVTAQRQQAAGSQRTCFCYVTSKPCFVIDVI